MFSVLLWLSLYLPSFSFQNLTSSLLWFLVGVIVCPAPYWCHLCPPTSCLKLSLSFLVLCQFVFVQWVKRSSDFPVSTYYLVLSVACALDTVCACSLSDCLYWFLTAILCTEPFLQVKCFSNLYLVQRVPHLGPAFLRCLTGV